eukprot:scaffold9223_cov46-Attheya_sp.AAC.1
MWEESGELPASFVQRFKKLEAATVALSTMVPTAIGAIGGRLGHQEDLALNTNTRLIATEGEVGEWVHSAGGSEQPAPTLWGALQGAYLESNRLRSLIAKLVQGSTTTELQDLRDEHNKVVEWLGTKIVPALQDANAEVAVLRLKVAALETAAPAQPLQASRPPAATNLSSLFGASLTGSTSASSTPAGANIKVLQLEKKMENLERIVGSEGVQVGGLGWRSQSKAGAWADQFLNMYSLGCFVDVLTFFEHVRMGHNGDKSGTLSKLEKLKKLNLSPADATVLVAHSNLVPGIFGRSTGEINATKTHLPALSKYTDFDVGDNTSGLKYIISGQMQSIEESLEEINCGSVGGQQHRHCLSLVLFKIKCAVSHCALALSFCLFHLWPSSSSALFTQKLTSVSAL